MAFESHHMLSTRTLSDVFSPKVILLNYLFEHTLSHTVVDAEAHFWETHP